ncbi:MAG TPA: class II aldolase/adducin family protein [Longimicrobiales bacterium]|nr:class II aldolase/adducin family protein [Longimicrobiales bacterium]
MLFSFTGAESDDLYRWFADGMRDVLVRNGHEHVGDAEQAGLVFNFFAQDRPRPFRRRAQAVFVVGVCAAEGPFEEPIRGGYPLLVRSLSNLMVVLLPDGTDSAQPDTHMLTLEQGHYTVSSDHDGSAYFDHVYRRVAPLATSRLVIDNIFEPDLEEALWHGDDITPSFYRAGQAMDALNLLPAPFPIREILPARDFRHVQRLYNIGGLSYGNMSARKDAQRYWMSASGVDKSNLREVGRDILMVKGYDEEKNAIRLSVPPNVEPRRVSVDAIEHWMIYREHPDVDAILHVHAWMDGIESTEMNFPCGTYEMGVAVADLVRQAPDPSCAVVGQKNHGLTITGRSLDEIVERVGGRLLAQVPMS